MNVWKRWLICVLLGCGMACAQAPLVLPSSAEEKALAAKLGAMSVEEAKAAITALPDAQTTVGLAQALREPANALVAKHPAEALEGYEKALMVAERAGNPNLKARVLYNIALAHRGMNEGDAAMEFYNRSLEVYVAEKAGPADLGLIYGALCVQRKDLGDFSGAYDDCVTAMKNSEDAKDAVGVARTLNNLGNVELLLGRNEEARTHFERGLVLAREQKQRLGEAMLLNNIGDTYTRQDDYRAAIEPLEQSLKIKEELGRTSELVPTLCALSEVYVRAGRYEDAKRSVERAAALAKDSGNTYLEAMALGHWGDQLATFGEHEAALPKLQEALQFSKAGKHLGMEGQITVKIAEDENSLKCFDEARRDGEAAMAIAERTEEAALIERASEALGISKSGLGDKEGARLSLERAADTVERLRDEAAGGDEGRSEFFSQQANLFQRLVQTDVSLGRDEAAFLTSEREKARMLLDLMTRGNRRLTQELTPPERAEEARLHAKLLALEAKRTSELQAGVAGSKASPAVESQLSAVRHTMANFRERMYAVHPELGRRRGESKQSTLKEAASVLRSSRSVVLEYEVTPEATYLFSISRGAAGPVLHTYKIEVTGEALQARVEKFAKELAKRDPGFGDSAESLYKLLLTPAQKDLAGKTSMILVPSGVLWRLSFQALRSGKETYLAQTVALSYAPSVATLRSLHATNVVRKSGPAVLAMGNPTNDLPEAEREVRDVQTLYGDAGTRVFVGSAASRENFLKNAPQFSVLHVAAHGAFDDRDPMYSHVLMAKDGEAAGEHMAAEVDAAEIAEMNLRAKLVVLSACETAAGKVRGGEGLIGLSWSFLAAGSRSTLASQWRAESGSATMLMVEVHRGLQQHMGAAEALQRAQRIMAKDPRYAHPFYWAGFVLMGED